MAQRLHLGVADQTKVLSVMTPEIMEGIKSIEKEVKVLRGKGEFEACLEKIVQESRRHPPESAPLFNSLYNRDYRLAVAHLPRARLNSLNERIRKGEFTIKHGWDVDLNREFRPTVEAKNRKAKQRESKQCSCGNLGVLACGRCLKQKYCCKLCQEKDWKV